MCEDATQYSTKSTIWRRTNVAHMTHTSMVGKNNMMSCSLTTYIFIFLVVPNVPIQMIFTDAWTHRRPSGWEIPSGKSWFLPGRRCKSADASPGWRQGLQAACCCWARCIWSREEWYKLPLILSLRDFNISRVPETLVRLNPTSVWYSKSGSI